MMVYNLKITLYSLLILVCAGACLKEDELNQPFASYEPKEIGDGLLISNPAAEQVAPSLLTTIYQDVYTDDALWSLKSLLVFRNGKLISEAYLKNEQDITDKQLIWSCTKQVMGLLSGIAIDRGLIDDVNDPISVYLADELREHPDKEAITIKNMLTMQSGIDYNNDGKDGQTDQLLREIPNNSVDFILARAINAQPGSEFHYNDGNPHLMSALIQKAAGKPTDEWADEVLFSKIEVTNYNWLRYKDGITLGGFGIETTPRELAKIALCVADGGQWKGQQVIDKNWIQAMTAPQVALEASDYAFGYFWWVDVSRGIHFMWGVGGQFAFIIPQKDLVVVMTSLPNTKGDYEIQANEALPVVDRIVQAAN